MTRGARVVLTPPEIEAQRANAKDRDAAGGGDTSKGTPGTKPSRKGGAAKRGRKPARTE